MKAFLKDNFINDIHILFLFSNDCFKILNDEFELNIESKMWRNKFLHGIRYGSSVTRRTVSP